MSAEPVVGETDAAMVLERDRAARSPARHRVVIVGGGFGGLNAAQTLRKVDADVTLIDRRNFHLFQPLLYQVAMGVLSPAHIASPLRGILHKQKNCTVLLGEVVGFDPQAGRVLLADGYAPFDSLIVAAGSTHSYFGHDEWAPLAPGLKSIEDATEIRRRVLFAFEHAEREADPVERAAWMTFVIVGGGPTGVELAGALSEVARQTLRDDFRHINPKDARILLVDGGDRLLSPYPPELSTRAEADLDRLRVEVHKETRVTNIEEGLVTITEQGGAAQQIAAWTVLWGAGVQSSGLARKLADACGGEADRAGRIKVRPDLSVPNFPNIFAIGDMASLAGADGNPLPGVAQVAIQQGQFAAATIAARVAGRPPKQAAFHYRDWGMMSTIGRRKAVAVLGNGWKFKGVLAWLMWLFVHLMSLVQYQNRIAVLFQWSYNYLTYNRSARLITGKMLPVKTRMAPAAPAASIGDPRAADTDHAAHAVTSQPAGSPHPAGSPQPEPAGV